MPTYQYRCTACSEPLEAVQAFTDAPLTECPSCDGALRKVFSTVGVVFKGSGFYKTDSRPAEKVESAGKDGDAKAPAADKAGKDGGKAADKPAAKSGEQKSDKKADKKAAAGSGSPRSPDRAFVHSRYVDRP